MTAVRIEIQRLPQSVDEFVALRDEHAPTPEGAAATMVVALLLYGEDQDLGKSCLAEAVDPSRTRMGASGDIELQPRSLNLIRRGPRRPLDAQPVQRVERIRASQALYRQLGRG